MIEERFRPVAEFAVAAIEAVRRTGLQVTALRERYAQIRMPLAGNLSHLGTMYAGSLFILGEFAGGILYGAAFDHQRFYPIVKELTIRYLLPARSDVTLTVAMTRASAEQIQGTADQNGKCDFPMDLELKDDAGETVAVVSGTWQLRKFAPGAGLNV